MKQPSKYVTPRPSAILKAHGGKFYLARRIIDLFPAEPFSVLCEPCCFGASVTFNVRPDLCRGFVLGDVNPDVINLYEVLKSPDLFARFHATVSGLTYSEDVFRQHRARFVDHARLDVVDRAACYYVTNRMSRGGLAQDFAWSERQRGGRPGDENGWHNAVGNLHQAHEALQRSLALVLAPAADMLKTHGRNTDWLWYIDPPYLQRVRSARKAYGAFEMTPVQHEELLGLAKQAMGRVLISMYHDSLYDQALRDWNLTEFDMPNHSGQNARKQRRIECVWRNY